MDITVDVTYRSLTKYSEILCGDTVELLKTEDSDVLILADGMGSGVKANILSTLTTKILGTMFLNGATLDECVETISQTLPICQERHVSYATFTILQIFNDGNAYLVEYDNPPCIYLRDGKFLDVPKTTSKIKDKIIQECRFTVQKGDTLMLMSDGFTHAGVGTSKKFCFGWPFEDIVAKAEEFWDEKVSAARLAAAMCNECNEIYNGRPGDDTTIAIAKIIDRKVVHIMTGPPISPDDDEKIVEAFMGGDAFRIVSGGTSATIVSRELGAPLRVSLDYTDPDIPPIAYMDGVDLVTEGVLTLRRVVSLLDQFNENKIDERFFEELDKNNGASMIAKVLIEDCTELNMYVGRAANSAYQSPGMAFDLAIRQTLVKQLDEAVKKMGKYVNITYY